MRLPTMMVSCRRRVVSALLAVALCAAVPTGTQLAAADDPLTVDLGATSIAFPGEVAGATSATRYVTLTNNGNAELTITGLAVRGEDFRATFGTCPAVLAAGASCRLGATFTPRAPGPKSGTLEIRDDAADSPQTVALTGTGLDTVSLSPSAITFPDQHVGTTSVLGHVTLTNIGDTPLTLSDVQIAGDTDDFADSLGNCPSELATQTSCQVSATFTPTALGSRRAQLLIFDSAESSPQSVALSGSGTGAPATAGLSANQIDFGDVQVGAGTTAQYVILTNKGDVPLIINRLDITGDRDFGDVINCGAPPVVPAGGSCQLGAVFIPTSGGVRTATILLSDSAADSPQQITLTGRGLTAPGAPTIAAVTAGDGTATVGFSPPTDDGGLPINGYTVTASPGGGSATGTASPITVAGLDDGTSYTFTVTATNRAGDGPSSAPSMAVTPVAPLDVTSGSPLPRAAVGQPYATTLTATGGIGPLGWSLAAAGVLPAGLTLLPDGTITGTPTTARTSRFTVQVTDAATPGHAATKTLSLTVDPAPARADLAVSVTHVSRFVSGRLGWYRISVTNTGGAATSTATTVAVGLPRGLTPMWGGAAGWACRSGGQTASCTHAGSLGAHKSSSVRVQVLVAAPAGRWLAATATVSPTDPTPADNTATDRVQVQRP
jgi:fibronectin type III domain protein/putative Ig domain-containing protein/uncharacterized protein DUF11/centrosomal CEP192-like protein